ncbi:hypothetical protein T07_8461 [Trichinella nelsoni]|uniref:Uncharacterized protein n=1 Tax=Trichinella nelsoni TaxID=6336 RepID=A0A0V0RCM2_9BILA|nr:hypothetical protein T07_8461 [Trichinella nelsoni]
MAIGNLYNKKIGILPENSRQGILILNVPVT